jgi:hypothetical protein
MEKPLKLCLTCSDESINCSVMSFYPLGDRPYEEKSFHESELQKEII